MMFGPSASSGPFVRQNCDAHKMLVHVERATDEFQEDVVDPQFEGLRMENVSAELYDLLCQACTGGRN